MKLLNMSTALQDQISNADVNMDIYPKARNVKIIHACTIRLIAKIFHVIYSFHQRLKISG